MSDARAEVWTLGGTLVGAARYQGSADAVYPRVLPMPLKDGWWDEATELSGEVCTHIPEPCFIWSDYAEGFYWPSTYCGECGLIHGARSPYPTDWGWTMPPAGAREREERWQAEGWPRNGHPFPDSKPTELKVAGTTETFRVHVLWAIGTAGQPWASQPQFVAAAGDPYATQHPLAYRAEMERVGQVFVEQQGDCDFITTVESVPFPEPTRLLQGGDES